MKQDDKGYYWNWALLLTGNAIGLYVISCVYFQSNECTSFTSIFSLSCHNSLFLGITLLTLLTTSLAAAPLIRFIHGGWHTRYEEFRNRLGSTSLRNYLLQYWEKMAVERGAISRDGANKVVFDKAKASVLFDEIYNQHYGKAAFRIPTILLLSVVFVEASLILLAQSHLVVLCDRFLLQTLIAAVAGAYMFVVSDAVWQVRTRSLNVTDVYWYALRMLLAEPIAMTINGASTAGNEASTLTYAAAFSICFLPVDVLVKLIRRIATQNQGEKLTAKEVDDTLLNLAGVSVSISSMLHAEGVNSVDQLIGMDPVLLSIRTGLPFKFMLNLISQAVVRRHLGNSVVKLALLDLTTCEQITSFIDDLNDQLAKSETSCTVILKLAIGNINSGTTDGSQVNEESLKLAFRNIKDDSFSKFLTEKE